MEIRNLRRADPAKRQKEVEARVFAATVVSGMTLLFVRTIGYLFPADVNYVAVYVLLCYCLTAPFHVLLGVFLPAKKVSR